MKAEFKTRYITGKRYIYDLSGNMIGYSSKVMQVPDYEAIESEKKEQRKRGKEWIIFFLIVALGLILAVFIFI